MTNLKVVKYSMPYLRWETRQRIKCGETFRITGTGDLDGIYVVGNTEFSSTQNLCPECPFRRNDTQLPYTGYCGLTRKAGSRNRPICVSDARTGYYVSIKSVYQIVEEL